MDTLEPVSWLRLERYHLGELSPEEAALVERAVAASPETRACLDQIRKPVALRPLPGPPSGAGFAASRKLLGTRWPALSFAVAAAAGIALFVWAHGRSSDLGIAPRTAGHDVRSLSRSVRVKGGEVAIGLVRERSGTIDTAPTSYAEGDRFKVLLTCPPGFDSEFDLVVFQEGVAAFPLGPPANIACGNGVPLPGAFALTGRVPATVCVTWSADPGARRTIAQKGIAAVGDSTACITLDAE